jgi:hypothetical protein
MRLHHDATVPAMNHVAPSAGNVVRTGKWVRRVLVDVVAAWAVLAGERFDGLD